MNYITNLENSPAGFVFPSFLKYTEIEDLYLSKKGTNRLARWMEVVEKTSSRGGCWKNIPIDILDAYEKLIFFLYIYLSLEVG